MDVKYTVYLKLSSTEITFTYPEQHKAHFKHSFPSTRTICCLHCLAQGQYSE